MKKITPAIILALVAAVVLLFGLLTQERAKNYQANADTPAGADGSLSASADQQRFEWKLVTSWPKHFPGLGAGPERFAQLVERMSGGRLIVNVYGGGELVPPLGVFDAVSSGSVEMGHSGAYFWKGKVAASQFFTSIPFGMNAQEMNGWLHYGGGLELWREIYEPFNLIPFPGGNTGVQMGGWFNKQVNSLDDLQGLKMRIPGLGGEVLNRAGGTAVTIPGGELFTALKTGVIDATEWVGPYNDLAFGFHQAAQYMYYPGWHEPGSVLEFTVNQKAWESLPADLQAIVEVATREVNQDMLDEYTARNNAALVELVETHGVEVRQFPKAVTDELRTISQQVIAEIAADDPQFAKVYQSFNDFQQQAEKYHLISEVANYATRVSE